jgi:superfamily II DNA or RNA helicase
MLVRFDRGTLVLEPQHAGEDPSRIPGTRWDAAAHGWRVPADQRLSVLGRLSDDGVRVSDESDKHGTARLSGTWSLPELRWYQREAVSRWLARGRRGVVALPTGSGKTLVALAAIAELGVPTLVLVPTRVLLVQWSAVLSAMWSGPIGRLGDGDHIVQPITVSTYASASSWMQSIGDRFGLVIVDEAHHVGAGCPAEIFEMLVAPSRLGLSATPTDAPAVLHHIGPIVHALGVEDLVNDGLAPYDHEVIEVELTRDERLRYRDARARFSSFYAPFIRARPGASWRQLLAAARHSAEGRDALAGWREARAVIAYPAGKRIALRELLARHAEQRMRVFTSDNASAYAIARELLVPPITHEIRRDERSQILAAFRAGELRALVSSKVLDEGLDVPEAEVAIVVGGTASQRAHAQRVGRVLRPGPGKRARVYELAVAATTEVGYVERRRAGLAAIANGGAP